MLAIIAIVVMSLLFHGHTFAVLDPKGTIAEKQRNLIVFATSLCLLIVVPVFAMTFGIVWKYRESNINAKTRYEPEWDHSTKAEIVWWGFPLLLITILGVVTWQSSRALDPFRPIDSATAPITVKVVALQWKWLFIYPDQNIASVNLLQFPENTPLNLEITADAPMNSLWIPQLGGQIYAMAGMETQLHLMATHKGDFRGSSANLSGEGFAGMKFIARASSKADFDSWVQKAKQSPTGLSQAEYTQLAKPSINTAPFTYGWEDASVYDTVITKYMGPDPAHAAHATDEGNQASMETSYAN
ncbi:MAG: Ubiquinol oxidase subunit 2 [Candidatus Saccharibacteria bacterium]|nr:Ubiquinol oxidase subunit 2 [Candidatus Saccharibacteria bacterium]